MKTNLLTFCIFLGSFFSISLAYGDDIPTQGRWDDEDYRSITALPPTLSINNNVLSIEFKDALDNLTIHITDENGNIIPDGGLQGTRRRDVQAIKETDGTLQGIFLFRR